MHRREFLVRTATAAGAVWLSSKTILNAIAAQPLASKFSAVRHRHARPDRNQDQSASDGYRYSRLRPSLQPDSTGHQGTL